MLKIKHFTNTNINNSNAYLITNNTKAILIDTAGMGEEILKYIDKNNLKLTDVFLTHCHFDHLLGLDKIQMQIEPNIWIGEDDYDGLFDSKINNSIKYNMDFKLEHNRGVKVLKGEMKQNINGFSIYSNTIKGHTKGTTFYQIEDMLFVGDTLLKTNLGFHRTDMYGCDVNKFYDSILWIINNAGDNCIYPGHHEINFKVKEVLDNHDHPIYVEKIIAN